MRLLKTSIVSGARCRMTTKAVRQERLMSSTTRRKRPGSKRNDATFGIRPVDYSKVPPIQHSPFAPPPRPGTKAAALRMVWPLLLLTGTCLGIFIYLNPEEDTVEFWKTMETGGAILPQDDDDDDDDLDDDEDDE